MGETTPPAAAATEGPATQVASATTTRALSDAEAAQLIADHLSSFTYDWMTERELQDHVAEILAPRFSAQRERALSARDRPDFLVDIGGLTIAVEVKIAGAHNAVLRQLGRYAAHDEIAAIVLASGKRTLLAGVPSRLHSTPIAVALLAGAL